MINTLYEKFQEWSEGGSVWLIGDTHFNDEDCRIMANEWVTPEEQVRLINSKVSKHDTLVILGDVGDASYIRKLHGRKKILVSGNHDRGMSYYKESGFDETYDGPLFISQKIVLSHEPLPDISYALNIHGHNHAGKMKPDVNHINLAANVIGYVPVSLKDIITGGSLSEIKDIHRIAIDRAKECPIKKQN